MFTAITLGQIAYCSNKQSNNQLTDIIHNRNNVDLPLDTNNNQQPDNSFRSLCNRAKLAIAANVLADIVAIISLVIVAGNIVGIIITIGVIVTMLLISSAITHFYIKRQCATKIEPTKLENCAWGNDWNDQDGMRELQSKTRSSYNKDNNFSMYSVTSSVDGDAAANLPYEPIGNKTDNVIDFWNTAPQHIQSYTKTLSTQMPQTIIDSSQPLNDDDSDWKPTNEKKQLHKQFVKSIMFYLNGDNDKFISGCASDEGGKSPPYFFCDHNTDMTRFDYTINGQFIKKIETTNQKEQLLQRKKQRDQHKEAFTSLIEAIKQCNIKIKINQQIQHELCKIISIFMCQLSGNMLISDATGLMTHMKRKHLGYMGHGGAPKLDWSVSFDKSSNIINFTITQKYYFEPQSNEQVLIGQNSVTFNLDLNKIDPNQDSISKKVLQSMLELKNLKVTLPRPINSFE